MLEKWNYLSYETNFLVISAHISFFYQVALWGMFGLCILKLQLKHFVHCHVNLVMLSNKLIKHKLPGRPVPLSGYYLSHNTSEKMEKPINKSNTAERSTSVRPWSPPMLASRNLPISQVGFALFDSWAFGWGTRTRNLKISHKIITTLKIGRFLWLLWFLVCLLCCGLIQVAEWHRTRVWKLDCIEKHFAKL